MLTFGFWEEEVSDCGNRRSTLAARVVNLLLEQESEDRREMKGRWEKRQRRVENFSLFHCYTPLVIRKCVFMWSQKRTNVEQISFVWTTAVLQILM